MGCAKSSLNGRYFQKIAQETRLSVSGIYVKSNGADFGPFFDASRPYNTFRQVEPQHNYTENNTMLMEDFIKRVQGKTSWEKEEWARYPSITICLKKLIELIPRF